MSHRRDLHPVTVYLPTHVKEYFEQQAQERYEPISATLRRVLLEHWSAQPSGEEVGPDDLSD